MKKTLLILSLVAMMLVTMIPVSAETTPGQDYWNEMKKLYEEWQAMESEAVLELELNFPNEIEQTFSINVASQSDMDEFDSYLQIEVTSDDPEMVIPTIEMYTEGANFYLNQEFVLFLAELAEMSEEVAFEEDFILIENSQTDLQLDSSFLVQILEVLETMEFDFDLNMTFEDDAYHLALDADDIIDLLDAYLMFVITNMDELSTLMGMPQEEVELTEEELKEILAMYEMFVRPMLQEAKEYIAGSTYVQTTTFGEDSYQEVATFHLKTPEGEMKLSMDTAASRLEEVDFQLPTSFKVVTEDDIAMMLLGGIEHEVTSEVVVVAVFEIDTDTVYQFDEYDVSDQEANITVSTEGRSYIPTDLAAEIFELEPTPEEEVMTIKSLEDHGYTVDWDEASRSIVVSLEAIY
ncbi:hypothetical protein SAMN05192551_105129 [Tindallia magadiensis]|uniref:Copper amine oxidase N-terminal domain-containing protein n=1 Tax=Tindallia magadiensis TaxID=69895 RepID=A0A1I3ERB1_9FIRM|nr:hypothetical protein [Tindallia magadiensis]SFI01492.1 hypothetical protein SAMN05192551_105129 [Tindallia magadiensis]